MLLYIKAAYQYTRKAPVQGALFAGINYSIYAVEKIECYQKVRFAIGVAAGFTFATTYDTISACGEVWHEGRIEETGGEISAKMH